MRRAVAGLTLLAACASSRAPPSDTGARPGALSPSSAQTPLPPPAFRLPTDVRPTREQLSLRIDPRTTTFSGTVRITLSVGAPVPMFWLHAQELQIGRAAIVQGGAERPARTVSAPPDLLGIIPGGPLVPGTAELVIDYQGPLDTERSRGLYRVDEADRPYAYTFFEPVDARRAFPCFDEPSFKIPWELEITTPAGNGVYANARESVRRTAPDGWETVRFEPTRPLPSYLVAFGVGPFDPVPGDPAGHHKTPLRFVVPKGRGPELAYARRVMPRIVALLEDATDLPYPYGKLDVLVVPRFWGTMEHPGLVALGQPLMLMPPGGNSVARQQRGASITVHELAHYWYGDLVTTAWWDDTWLNEAFGTWIDLKVTDRLEPHWRWHRRAIPRREQALAADSLASAKRIRQPVHSREDVDASFDAPLTYFKGSTVIAMFERWIGEDLWRRAMAGYLRGHADGNATSDELYRSLDSGTGRSVSALLSTFVDQPGFPLISASLRCGPKAPPTVELSQERFVPAGVEASRDALWQTPVCVRASRGRRVERACTVLQTRSGSLTLPASLRGCPDWVLVNDGGLAYYRVAYTYDLRARLLALPTSSLSAEEQVALASDLSALTERGDVPVEETLSEAVKLARQKDSDLASMGWALLERWLRTDRLSPQLRARRAELIRSLGQRQGRTIGWTARTGEAVDARELRGTLLPLVALEGEDRQLQAEAGRRARAWLKDRSGADEDVVEQVLAVAAARGDAPLFETMVKEALVAPVLTDRTRIIEALGRFEDPALAARARALLDDPRFELRDTAHILSVQMSRAETRPAAWPILRDRAGALVPRMRDDEAKWMISSIGASCDPALRDEAERTLGPVITRIDGGPFAFRQALGSIGRCVAVHARTDDPARAWLVSQTRQSRPAAPRR
jgi:cytosol alanyl aminopeptidase